MYLFMIVYNIFSEGVVSSSSVRSNFPQYWWTNYILIV